MAQSATPRTHWIFSNFHDVEGGISLKALDNWDDNTYRSVEHAYQAAKTLDADARARIAATPSPTVAKRLGRQVDLRPSWHFHVHGMPTPEWVMLQLLRQKFATEPHRSALLASTGDLVEHTTWHDRIWGVCDCPRHQGQGQNALGRLLTRIREELRAVRSEGAV